MEIRHREGGKTPLLSDQLMLRDALGGYVRARWPTNTAKSVQKEWALTLDEAKGVMLGRASQTTIDKIMRHRNGGWAVVLPVMGAVIGQPVEQFIQSERKRHAEQAQRHRALVRDLRALGRDRALSDLEPRTWGGEGGSSVDRGARDGRNGSVGG